VVGPNGSGKTTFLKTLTGRIPPVKGAFHWGTNVRIGFYDQELAGMDPDSTVLGQLQEAAPRVSGGTPEGALRSFLARFLFTGEAVFKRVAVLSGGELSRLALAKLIYAGADILILDEPTNHLDIPSREALEGALAEYGGTIIVVSHDRYFLGKLASQVLEFDDGIATHAYGGYLDFYEASRQKVQVKKASARQAGRRPRKAARVRDTSNRGRSQTEIERDIGLLESEMAELSGKLAEPPVGVDLKELGEMGSRHNSIASKLTALYQEWEEACLTAEQPKG
jgi:ATP-binding cassette subfamily F protein 3